ncbi:MAG: GTP cyclohydrolase II [Burkholderiales bacterium]
MLKTSKTTLPLDKYGTPEIITLADHPQSDGKDHFALLFGGPVPADHTPLVRVHSECVTGDVLGSLRCDCGKQLSEALERLSREGGVLVYLRQEGRGIGLHEKIKAYGLQDAGLDTYQANLQLGHREDARSYGIAADLLRSLGIERVRLLTRNPEKINQLRAVGIEVTEQVQTQLYLNPHNERYLGTKEARAARPRKAPSKTAR